MHTSLLIPLLAAALPQGSPEVDMQPMVEMGRCVVSKAQEWAASSEDAKVIVETAIGSCEDTVGAVRKSALLYIDQSAPDLSAKEKLAAAEEMVEAVEGRVRNLGYQAVIKARMAP